MSAMSPLDAAFVAEAMEAIDAGGDTVDMRDGHSEFYGADQLGTRLESTKHKVEWIFHNTKMQWHTDEATGIDSGTIMKDGGAQEMWDDGWLVTKLNNVNGLKMGQSVDGCHIKFGMTANPQDTSLYENGFWLGVFPEHKVMRGEKGGKSNYCGKYELSDRITARILRGAVTVLRNDEEEPFDVVGECDKEGTSMYGMIQMCERDAMGQLEQIWAIAMVTSIDINGNLLTDAGIERLATALEVNWSKVEHLDVGLNRMRDAGAIRIAQVLEKHSSKIKSLVMSHNEIGDEGVARLAEALEKEDCKVTKLWLTGNQIGDPGAIRLAEALEKETCSLELIELAWNAIEDEGAQRLIQAISKPECKVAHFTLDHNKYIDKKTRKMLTMIMGKIPRLVDMT